MELLVCLDVLLQDSEAIERLGEENRVIVLQSALDALYEVNYREHDKIRNARKIISKLRSDYTRYELACDQFFHVYDDKPKGKYNVESAVSVARNQSYVLVTNDLRAIARAENSNVTHIRYVKPPSLMERPIRTLKIDTEFFNEIGEEGSILLEDEITDCYENEYMVLQCGDIEALAVYRDEELRLLEADVSLVGGIEALDRYQACAIDACLDGRIPLVVLTGKAGVGKTLMAIASAFTKVKSKSTKRILISRPIVPMGNELGHLPGTLEDKMKHWVQPLYDNINLLQKQDDIAKSIVSKGIVQVQSLEHIRGRSIRNAIVIIDEAQNLSPEEVKAVITRIGKGGKLILCGDPYQTDKGGVESNGLAYVTERLKGNKLMAHVHLLTGHRSAIAELAADKL